MWKCFVRHSWYWIDQWITVAATAAAGHDYFVIINVNSHFGLYVDHDCFRLLAHHLLVESSLQHFEYLEDYWCLVLLAFLPRITRNFDRLQVSTNHCWSNITSHFGMRQLNFRFILAVHLLLDASSTKASLHITTIGQLLHFDIIGIVIVIIVD